MALPNIRLIYETEALACSKYNGERREGKVWLLFSDKLRSGLRNNRLDFTQVVLSVPILGTIRIEWSLSGWGIPRH